MSRIAILGAGMNGLIAAHYLKQAGHKVTVIERGPAPLQTWRGWKVLLKAPTTEQLLKDLGVPCTRRRASNAVLLGGQVIPLDDMTKLQKDKVRLWYTARTRRSMTVDSSVRMPSERYFLDFSVAELDSQLTRDIQPWYGAAIKKLPHYRGDVLLCRYEGQDIPVYVDYVVSTIPFWAYAELNGWRHWPLMTAVSMIVYRFTPHLPKCQKMMGHDYIYTPHHYHCTRIIPAKPNHEWQVEAVVDPFIPVPFAEEEMETFGKHLGAPRKIPGQLLPQVILPSPLDVVPKNVLLMGRHAAWEASETIDISIERFFTWAKENQLI